MLAMYGISLSDTLTVTHGKDLNKVYRSLIYIGQKQIREKPPS